MFNIFAIFIGGGFGSVLRYLVNLYIPAPTLIVNILGSLVIGFLYAIFVDKIEISNQLKLALTVGFCGGLTTFSTFSLELFKMLEKGEILQSLGYILVSVIICLLFTGIGVYFGKSI